MTFKPRERERLLITVRKSGPRPTGNLSNSALCLTSGGLALYPHTIWSVFLDLKIPFLKRIFLSKTLLCVQFGSARETEEEVRCRQRTTEDRSPPIPPPDVSCSRSPPRSSILQHILQSSNTFYHLPPHSSILQHTLTSSTTFYNPPPNSRIIQNILHLQLSTKFYNPPPNSTIHL